jgi:FkbM family methyltransferase
MAKWFAGRAGKATGSKPKNRRGRAGGNTVMEIEQHVPAARPVGFADGRVAVTISVCCLKDIATWEVVARHVLRCISAGRHLLVVPDDEISFFKSRTPSSFDVVGESRYVADVVALIANRMPPGRPARTGWYLQQIIKLRALAETGEDDVAVIWDADTVPLRRLNFVDGLGRLVHWKGTEDCRPYFTAIERLLGMEKAVGYSFIAQCLAIRGRWMREFIDLIERRHGRPWIEAILASIDFSQTSGFSEYETLGTFLAHKHPNEIAATDRPWLRQGRWRLGEAANVDSTWARPMLWGFDFVAFEGWQEPFGALKRRVGSRALRLVRRLQRGWQRLNGRPVTLDDFLARWFGRPGPKTVIQIGANDGVQNDPLRKFLKQPGDYSVILVEPLPYYASCLRKLYAGRPDVAIVEAAVGAETGTRRLYFIPPEIADQMDGDGPPNRWAHGQGSFDMATVEHWIKANAFRGDSYRQRIPFFLDSVAFADVPLRPASEILPGDPATAGDTLLVIDVQGAELEVLKGVDWSRPPRCVVVEDDLGRGAAVTAFLEARGYRHVCGDHDKVFVHSAGEHRA